MLIFKPRATKVKTKRNVKGAIKLPEFDSRMPDTVAINEAGIKFKFIIEKFIEKCLRP